jgi:oleate hydratase
MEFHRHLCEYFDHVQHSNIQTASPLQLASEPSIYRTLQGLLREQGVVFSTGLSVLDLSFNPDTEPRTVCGIEALENGKPVLLPVAKYDIVIVKLGSPISGSICGSSGLPPSRIPADAETLLNCDWSLWFRLAKASSKFGNPSAFCTHISESLLETFTVLIPPLEYKLICEQVNHSQGHDGHLISIAYSNWSIKLVFPQSQSQPGTSQEEDTCALIGYALTPKENGNLVKKPMCACSGDEILAELLWQLNIPFDGIVEKVTVNSRLLPLGLSPLLTRSDEDRPSFIPANTTNIALIGQYVEIEGESTLGLEYGIRSAELAVQRLLNLDISLPKVKRSTVVARYGNCSRKDYTQ